MRLPKLRPLEVVVLRDERGMAFLLRDPLGVAPEVILSERAFYIARHFDGEMNVVDLQVSFMRRYGELLFKEEVEKLVQYLDENFLLETPRFEDKWKEVKEEWALSRVREPAFSGSAYPKDPVRLKETLDSFFELKEVPEVAGLKGIIAPHIDFQRGGGCYGSAYAVLKGRPSPGLVAVFGTCHQGIKRPFSLTDKAFRTPLGLVEVDTEALIELKKAFPYDPLEESILHRREHTVEFQLPFLQLIWGDGFKLLPILCRPPLKEEEEEFFRSLQALREVIGQKGAFVVASADLAHVGPQFGDPNPIDPLDLSILAQKDREMLSFVEAGDAMGFLGYVRAEGDRRRICGVGPIFAVLKILEPVRAKVLDYRQWRDPQGIAVVTFASLALIEGE